MAHDRIIWAREWRWTGLISTAISLVNKLMRVQCKKGSSMAEVFIPSIGTDGGIRLIPILIPRFLNDMKCESLQ